MGVPSWMVRRFPRGGRGVDDEVKLDPKKGFVENLREVLNNVCKRQGISEDKRIAYLNSFIRLINPGNNQEIGLSRDDFFHCLRPLLLHESVRVRATALNLVRHFLRSKQDFASCIKLQYSFLIARSLDVKVQSDSERVQALCVARRMLCVDADRFPMAVARALVAIATSTIEEKDRLLRAALAALVELCLLNPDTFITAGGVTALTRNLLTIGLARMTESMLGALLFLLNKPGTRQRARIDLNCLAAPYTDPGGGAKGGLDWAHMVLVSLLRSWPGVLHFCHTEREGLRSLVATLYLNQHDVRRSVVDLLYEVLNVPQPDWSDEPQVALEGVDPSRYQDAFRLGEGFVAAEGRTVLPHCSRTRVNLQEVHLSLLLYSFLEAGILDAIVEVIVCDDSFLSVRATILLGEILHLTHLLLPPECCHVTPVLPTLVSYAVRGRRSAANLSNFGANRSSSSAHYERFRRQMQQQQLDRRKENGRKREGEGVRGKRERRRTVSGQSCRSRTVSGSSGDRSRLDRDSISAQVDSVHGELYSSGEPKTTSKATSLLRDIQIVLKDKSELNSSTTSLDDNLGQPQEDYDKVGLERQRLEDDDKVAAERKRLEDDDKVCDGYDKVGEDYKVGDGDKVGDDDKVVSGDSRVGDDDKVVSGDSRVGDDDKVGGNYGRVGDDDKAGDGDKLGVDYDKVCGDSAGNFWEPGLQPLPEFFEKGVLFEEDDDNRAARFPVDEPYSIRVQQRALTAVSTLARLHRLLRKRPAPSSIFLDHLITSIDKKQTPSSSELARAKGKTASKSKLAQLLNKESEETIKDSGVLVVKDPFSWNWDKIRSILKGKTDVSNETNRIFLRKLLQFFLPSSRQLMRIDVGSDRRVANIYTMTALDFLDCLLASPKDSECEKMLYELLGNISTEICQLKSSPHSCLLSPQNVSGTLCSDYFLYIGHLSRWEAGRTVLEKTGVFKQLLELISSTNLDCYVRLGVSTLDYTEPGPARKLMEAATKSDVVSFRLYATKLLHVLLRTPMQDCKSMIDWVIVLLIDRVSDTDRATSNVALEALDEACDCVEYLRSVVKMFPIHLSTHSDSGLLVAIRVLSTPEGFVRMLEEGFVKKQLAYWGEEFNQRYVCVVEARLCDSLTLHERNEDGTYCARVSGVKRSPNDVFVPPHVYGQLVQHEAGFNMLIADEHVKKQVEIILESSTSTDTAVSRLKAAVWALGAVASWPAGARWLAALGVTSALVRLVGRNGTYSVRGTALYALSQLSTNEAGAQALREGGWHTTRHTRHDRWPVLVKLDLMEDVVVNDDDEEDTSQDSSSCGGGLASADNSTLGRGHFYLPGDDPADQLSAGRERRAATLPAGSRLATPGGTGYQHTRSYSESKADAPSPRMGGADSVESRANLSIDGLRKNLPSSCDISSGSSTDSVQQYGKYNVGDRIQTLSPIPSSGSLTTLKHPAVTHPRSRRTSVNSTSSHKSARLSQQDALGYATLRFLHRGRRPLLSTPTSNPHPPSPLSPIDQLLGADLRRQISPLVRPRRLHPGPTSSACMTSSFDAGHTLAASGGGWLDVTATPKPPAYQSSRSCIARGSDASGGEESSWSGPTYLGICLPHNLCDLFPSDDLPHDKQPLYARTDVDTNQDAGADNNSSAGGDSETDTGTDSGGGGGGGLGGGAWLASAAAAANSSSGRQQRRRHDRQNCLLCTSNRAANQRVSRLRKISSSSTHRTRTETESSYGAANEGESPIMLPWQNRTCGGLEGVNSVDSSSTDAASIVHRSPMDNMRSRSMVRRDILKLACQLANPVLYKTCKQALLQLKQLYNDLFQDICVYSDVCSIIANSMHRIQARRFLQELFLDIPFTELYEDAITLLSSSNGGGGENGNVLDHDYDQLMQSGGGGDQLLGNQLTAAGSADDSDANPSAGNFRPSKSGAKSAFTDEQRSNPLLEVIPEHDARSDSSGCLSQSMLNLSDFSAPNSFEDGPGDGVMMLSASFDRRVSSQNTATTLLSADRPRLHSASSYTKPMILRTLTNSDNQTSHSDALLCKTSTSLPSSCSSSRPRPTRRSLSIEKETEKAKQLIELSSSNISVLQETLKQSSPTLSSSSSASSANQARCPTLPSSVNQMRGSTLSPSSAAANQVGGFVQRIEEGSEESADRKDGSKDEGLKSADQKKELKTVDEGTSQIEGSKCDDLESADRKECSKDGSLKSADQKKELKTVDDGTSQIEGLKCDDLESADRKNESKNVGLEGTRHEKAFKNEDLELADEKMKLKNVDIEGTIQKRISKTVDLGDANQTKESQNLGSSFKSDESNQSQKLDLILSNVEVSSMSNPLVDQSLSKLEIEVVSISSQVSHEKITEPKLSKSKLVDDSIATEEKCETQRSSITKTNIDSAVNFGNELSDDDPKFSNQESLKAAIESTSGVKSIADSLQRLSDIERASLKSSSLPVKSVAEAIKQKSSTKDVLKTCSNIESMEQSSKESSSESSCLNIEETESAVLILDSDNSNSERVLKTKNSSLKIGSTSLKEDSHLKADDGSSRRESSAKLDSSLKANSSSKVDSSSKGDSLKFESSSNLDSSLKVDEKSASSSNINGSTKSDSSKFDSSSTTDCSYKKSDSSQSEKGFSSSKSDSSPLKAGSSSSKLETSSSKTETITSKSGSGTSKSESGSSKLETSSSKTETITSKSGSGNSKSESGSSKLETNSSKTETITSKSESGSSKTETITSKSGSGTSKSESGSSNLETSSSKTETITSKSESGSSKSESSSSKPESTSSKPSKEAKPGIRGKRLKSHLNTGPSLLSTSFTSSSSKTSTKSKRSNDVTGPGSENTKPTAGSGCDNTKPTAGLGGDNTRPTASSVGDNTKPTAGSGSDNTKPTAGLGGDNTKPTAGSGSDNTKPATTGVKSQRQRKKATAKEPIRESLEIGKK